MEFILNKVKGYKAWYGKHIALCLTLINGNVSRISIALRTVINL